MLGVLGVCGRGGVGFTRPVGAARGVNSLAVGFRENSFALGFSVDFLTLSVLGVLAAGGEEAVGVTGVSWPG